MKKIMIPILTLLAVSSCDYVEVNTDKYGATDRDEQMVGFGAPLQDMQQLVIPIGSPLLTTGPGNDLQNTDLISSGNYIGYFGNNNNWGFSLESNWNFVENRMDYAYKNFYSNIFKPWNEIHQALKEVKDPYNRQIYAIANIVKNVAWLRATDVFGPIVYTQAGDGSLDPSSDSQETVYKLMLEDLSKSVEALKKASEDILPEYDLIYNGNTSQWLKLANSLMLRMAVRVHFKDEALAREYIAKALNSQNGGVISSKEDEAKIGNSDKKPLLNSMLASMGYGETRMGATIWSYLDGYEDPRLDVYFKKGMAFGTSSWYPDRGYFPVAPTNKLGKQKGQSSAESASQPNVTSDSPLYWFRASETYFLKAEAALYNLTEGDPKELYEQGVRMSFSENGLTGADAYLQRAMLPSDMTTGIYRYGDSENTYECTISTKNVYPAWDKLNSASGLSQQEQHLQQIITQKYLALYPNAVEAWTEYRRTGFPFLMKPFDEQAAGRIGAEKDCMAPERFRFAPSEYTRNPNMAKTPALLGGDDIGSTKLWWVRDNRPKQ